MGSYYKSRQSRYPVAAGVTIEERDQVSINASGYAVPAPAPASGVTGVVVGSAVSRVVNTGGADGDKFVTVDHSLGDTAFFFAHVGLTNADCGKAVYVGATPKTVSTTATNAVRSGTLQGIDDDGRARVIFTL